MSVSSTTGEPFYSGTYENVKEILRVMNVGEGKMAALQQSDVEFYQEFVDRDCDSILSSAYQVPIRAFNMVGLTGTQGAGPQSRVFPGDVRRAALYWTAGQILISEFQQLEANLTEQATQMVSDARMQIYAMVRTNHRIPGQRRLSWSKTMPPNLQPNAFPERPS